MDVSDYEQAEYSRAVNRESANTIMMMNDNVQNNIFGSNSRRTSENN